MKTWMMQKGLFGNMVIVSGYSKQEIARLKSLPQSKAEQEVFDVLGEKMTNVIHCGYGYYGNMTFGNDCVYLRIGDTND